jgi:hypothetical protein
LPKPPAQANVLDHLIVAYFQEAQNEEEIASAYGTNEADRIQAAFATFLSLARRDADVARSPGMIACAKAEPEERFRGRGRTAERLRLPCRCLIGLFADQKNGRNCSARKPSADGATAG